MHIKKVPVASLEIKAYTRLQCMLGCVHYKRNPMCPPSCPDVSKFGELVNSYQHVDIYFENIMFDDQSGLVEKRRLFQEKLLKEECRLRKEGNFYALCFFSGACSMCGDEICNLDKCKRPLTGRMAVCATGIDIMNLCDKLLKVSKEHGISYWKPLFSEGCFENPKNKHLCLGFIFY